MKTRKNNNNNNNNKIKLMISGKNVRMNNFYLPETVVTITIKKTKTKNCILD